MQEEYDPPPPTEATNDIPQGEEHDPVEGGCDFLIKRNSLSYQMVYYECILDPYSVYSGTSHEYNQKRVRIYPFLGTFRYIL